MRPVCHTACLLAFLAGQGVAADPTEEFYVHNPGFCDAPAGEQELADLATLDETGINSHAVSCTWTPIPQSYAPGMIAEVTALCDNGARQWHADFAVSADAQGRVTAFDDGTTGLPDYYFPCSKWGYKGDSTENVGD